MCYTEHLLFSTGVNNNLSCVPSYKRFAEVWRAGILHLYSFVGFLGGWLWIWEKDVGSLRKEVEPSVTVAKAEKSFLLKCEFNLSTNFCIWANLERNKLEVIIIQLPTFMSLVTYELSFEKEYYILRHDWSSPTVRTFFFFKQC